MESVALGLWLGLASGISPGPMLTLVVVAALRWGWRHGVTVAMAPLVSDLVIVTVTLVTLGQIPSRWVLALGVIGGVVVGGLGVATIGSARTSSLAGGDATVPSMRVAFGQASRSIWSVPTHGSPG